MFMVLLCKGIGAGMEKFVCAKLQYVIKINLGTNKTQTPSDDQQKKNMKTYHKIKGGSYNAKTKCQNTKPNIKILKPKTNIIIYMCVFVNSFVHASLAQPCHNKIMNSFVLFAHHHTKQIIAATKNSLSA